MMNPIPLCEMRAAIRNSFAFIFLFGLALLRWLHGKPQAMDNKFIPFMPYLSLHFQHRNWNFKAGPWEFPGDKSVVKQFI